MKQRIYLIYPIWIIIAFAGCKSTTSFMDKETGIKITLPEKANSVESLSLENKFSGKFYRKIDESFTLKWDENYVINNEIYVGINFGSNSGFSNPIKQASDLAGGTNAISSAFEREDRNINNRDYLILFYMKKGNDNDYFVDFNSDLSNPVRAWGRIRFPATFPLERIRKETYNILSGIEFKKK